MPCGMTTSTPDALQTTPTLTTTWPRFRFASRRIREDTWHVVPDLDDDVLAELGWVVASQTRDASGLDEEQDDYLRHLLTAPRWAGDDAKLHELLALCPFTGRMPPIDLDPQTPTTPDELRTFAERFEAHWLARGLGSIQWFTTGNRGLHGHFPVPEGVASPYLVRAYGVLVREVAKAAGLDILTEFRAREGRPALLVDDSLYDRDATGRGGLWRLDGAIHDKGLKRKSALAWSAQATLGPQHADHLHAAITQVAQSRARQTRGIRKGLPKPRPELLGKGAMKRTATVIQHFCREGANHEFRKALAGWLLRDGVPAAEAGATIAATGDPTDSLGVVRTTSERIAQGRPAFGFKKLRSLIGTQGARQLTSALERDLEELHAPPRNVGAVLTPEERETLREAAHLSEQRGQLTRARSCKRASRCGNSYEEKHCSSCGALAGTRVMVAERVLCPHCAVRRSSAILQWICAKWFPRNLERKLAVFTLQLPDRELETARKARRHWSRSLPPYLREHTRWLIAPGWIFVTCADSQAADGLALLTHKGWTRNGGIDVDKVGELNFLNIVAPMVSARATHLRRYLRLGDAQGLANDAWCQKVMEASGGAKARAALPWPKAADLRRMHVNAKRVRQNLEPIPDGDPLPNREFRSETPHCEGGHFTYTGRDSATREVIAIRNDRKWEFDELAKRAELGWRGEVMEFNDYGQLVRHRKPEGWDLRKLQE